MLENKRELIKKGAIVLAVILVLGSILFVACGKGQSGNKNSDSSQTENGGTQQVGTTEGEEEWNESLTENATEQIENVTETEGVVGETDGQDSGETGAQNGSSNGTGQNTPSGNTNPNREGNQVGLGEESYEYIAQNPSAGSSKEKQLAKEIAKKIIKNGMSDFEKVKAINDYMILNVTYDRENYEKGTIPYESYTALGAMEKKTAVCAGYAQMFRLVAQAAGLDATYVVGDTPYGYHGWNQVKVDGKWYNIDTTWNDGDYETRTSGHYYCGCYEYFVLSNADFEKTHTPHGKVNSTGSSRDLEGAKSGCPYDGKLSFCETQADVTKVVKSMVDSNVMQKRIMTNNSSKIKTMVETALKELKVYGDYKVNIKDKVHVYLESTGGVYTLTIDIVLESNSFEEAKGKKATSLESAKSICETEFKKPLPENTTTLETFYLFTSPQFANNNDFEAELTRWAFYEKKMSLAFIGEWEKVDADTYKIRVGRSSAAGSQSAFEQIYHTKDIEAAVKRMFEYGYKKISLYVQPDDYQLTGSFNEAGYAFENTFCKPLNEKYCLRSDWDQVHPDQNEISIYFSAEGHDTEYVDWEIAKEATCVSEGLQVKYCKICHAVAEQQVIPKDDNHDYYWATNGSNRTRKCHSCSYTGLSEVCIGGVWGYFDDAAAQAKIQEINAIRAQQQVLQYDEWLNPIGIFTPQALAVSSELTQKAKDRLPIFAPLDRTQIATCEPNEFVSKAFEKRYATHLNETRSAGVSEDDMYRGLDYGTIGVACFYYDIYDDGSRMMPIYVIEFGLTNN